MDKPANNILIVEGGALRSVFSTGLLDGFLKWNFNPFDCYIGVSAGASNIITYMAEMPGKSINIILDLALRKEFISYSRFLLGGHLLDLDWLFNNIFTDTHLDFNKVYHQGKSFYVCATDVETGQAVYVNTNLDNIRHAIKASTALPLLYRDFPLLNGRPMTDGGVADGIPIAKAIQIGGKKIMVVRSRSKNYLKKDTVSHKYIRWKLRKYTQLTATMRKRSSIHTKSLQLIRNPPTGVEILEVCPPEWFNITRFSRNRHDLLNGYDLGLNLAEETISRWIAASR